MIEGNLVNDIDDGHDPRAITHDFEPGKVGLKIHGRALYQILVEKKKQLGQADFESWVKNKGENFAKTTFAARKSENPVLIVYTLK